MTRETMVRSAVVAAMLVAGCLLGAYVVFDVVFQFMNRLLALFLGFIYIVVYLALVTIYSPAIRRAVGAEETNGWRELVYALAAVGCAIPLSPLVHYLLSQSWYGATPLIVDGAIGIFLISLALVIRTVAIHKGKYHKKVH